MTQAAVHNDATEALRVDDLHKSFGTLAVLKGVTLTAHEHDIRGDL